MTRVAEAKLYFHQRRLFCAALRDYPPISSYLGLAALCPVCELTPYPFTIPSSWLGMSSEPRGKGPLTGEQGPFLMTSASVWDDGGPGTGRTEAARPPQLLGDPVHRILCNFSSRHGYQMCPSFREQPQLSAWTPWDPDSHHCHSWSQFHT